MAALFLPADTGQLSWCIWKNDHSNKISFAFSRSHFQLISTSNWNQEHSCTVPEICNLCCSKNWGIFSWNLFIIMLGQCKYCSIIYAKNQIKKCFIFSYNYRKHRLISHSTPHLPFYFYWHWENKHFLSQQKVGPRLLCHHQLLKEIPSHIHSCKISHTQQIRIKSFSPILR